MNNPPSLTATFQFVATKTNLKLAIIFHLH